MYTIEDIKSKVRKLSNNTYECISNVYEGAHDKLKFKCDKGHEYKASWNNFRQGKRCPTCSHPSSKHKLSFVKESIENTNYKLLSDKYNNNHQKLLLECDKGHKFNIAWKNFLRGSRCSICYKENYNKENHNRWRGGRKKAWYDTYVRQISWCEEVRRDPENNDYLQVKCTEASCRKWFNPSDNQVRNRVNRIKGAGKGECRLYCSEECKQKCSLYNQKLYPKGQKPYKNRPDQSEWRSMVLERDNHECQRCGETKDLIAHHIEGLNVNPIMSADVDIGITLCKKCDKETHSEIGCRPIDLTKNNICL